MFCPTDNSWLYWSRGEASFLNHQFWMKTGNWTTLVCAEVFALRNLDCCHLSLQIWCVWV